MTYWPDAVLLRPHCDVLLCRAVACPRCWRDQLSRRAGPCGEAHDGGGCAVTCGCVVLCHAVAWLQVLRDQLSRRAGPGGEALIPSLQRALGDLQERLIYR